jgi:hypothetical protein
LISSKRCEKREGAWPGYSVGNGRGNSRRKKGKVKGLKEEGEEGRGEDGTEL